MVCMYVCMWVYVDLCDCMLVNVKVCSVRRRRGNVRLWRIEAVKQVCMYVCMYVYVCMWVYVDLCDCMLVNVKVCRVSR